MTTLKGYYLKIPGSFSATIKRNVTYKLTGLLFINGETQTFDSITYSYSYSGSTGGRRCSSGPNFCLGSYFGPSGKDQGTITIGTHSWSGTNSFDTNIGSNINRLITFNGTAVQILITGGDDVANSQAVDHLSSLPGTKGAAAIIDLTTIGLDNGVHNLRVRASDDGQTKNMSDLSNIINYTQE